MSREKERQRRRLAHRANRERQRQGHRRREEWRTAPATPEQITALRQIAMSNGHTFKDTVNRGEAWRRIREATRVVDEQLRLKCAPPWYSQPTRLERQKLLHSPFRRRAGL